MTVHPATNGTRKVWPTLAGLTLLLGVAAALASLANWQWQRAAEKDRLIARQAERGQLAPLSWSQLQALGPDVSDRPVRLVGQFDPARRVALDNQMRAGVAGYHLYVAFRPEGSSESVLVNIGWVPTDRDGGPAVPQAMPSAHEITGWAMYPSAFLTVGQPEFTRGLWRAGRIVPADWGRHWGMPLVPWVVRLAPEVPGGYVREWKTGAEMRMSPDRHRAYAFQWAALAVAWCICCFYGWRKLGGERS